MVKGSKTSLTSLYYQIEKESIEKYGKAGLFLQKGKFFELYSVNPTFPSFCDLLNLQCSRVNKNTKDPPSLDNPYFSGFQTMFVDKYIKILVEKNYTVVIVEEIGEKVKGQTMTREITRVVSPSNFLESTEICPPLLVIYISHNILGIAYVNLSTGKITLYPEQKYNVEIIRTIISQINPSEILLTFDTQIELESYNDHLTNNNIMTHKKNINKEISKINYQNQLFSKVYKLDSIGMSPIEYLKLELYPLSSIVLCLLLQFAVDHDSLLTTNLKLPEVVNNKTTLYLSENSIEELHLVQISKFCDYTSTSMGERLLKERIMNPSISKKIIQKRYDSIINFDKTKLIYVQKELKQIRDIDKLFRKISTNKLSVSEIPSFYNSLSSCRNVLNEIYGITPTLNNLNILLKLFEKKINLTDIENKIFNESIYIELDVLYQEKEDLNTEFQNIRKEISELDNEGELKVGICNNTLYFICSKTRADGLKKLNDRIISKNTSSEQRLSTKRIDKISDRLNKIEEDLVKHNNSLFRKFCEELSEKYFTVITKVSKQISEIDLNVSCCTLMLKRDFIIPTLHDKDDLEITGMWHPLIKDKIDTAFVENDVFLNETQEGILLYGLNFSGKSSLLRNVGICIILAQSSIPVPCKSFNFSAFKNLITKISLGDNLHRNQSLFTNEMKEIKRMIESDEHSIILADELLNSTDHLSALSLVSSTILSLMKNKCKFIFTSHMHELLDIPEIKELNKVKAYHMKVLIKDGKLIFDRKLTEGECDSKNYGIEVAQMMNLSSSYIFEANKIRNRLTNTSEIISTKKSRYNGELYMTECKFCGSTKDLETHHIVFQNQFSKESVNKHVKSNLMSICGDCHKELHKEK